MEDGADGALVDVRGQEGEGLGGEGLGGAPEVGAFGGVDAGEADGDLKRWTSVFPRHKVAG